MICKYLCLFFLLLHFTNAFSQNQEGTLDAKTDVVDLFNKAFPKFKRDNRDTLALENGKKIFWILPSLGYSQQTSLVGILFGNLAFKNKNANVSTVVSGLHYTLEKQAFFSSMANIWSKNNNYNIVGDFRLMQFPQETYGLGSKSSLTNTISMDYAYLRFYQFILKKIRPNFYGGLGFNLDKHWNIISIKNSQLIETISRYPYGIYGTSSSIGISANLLFDSRKNSIYPLGGGYANGIFRTNRKALGSDENYNWMLLDFRKYFRFSKRNENILALWNYNIFTFNGNAPFLDLPSTASDTYGNSGRGYIQSRYRGKNFLYSEAEYRFGISRNKLIGGVIFANAETVPLKLSKINTILPAAGVGLRIKLNKLSRTNVCIDYAFGKNGSSGVFFNIGEVF